MLLPWYMYHVILFSAQVAIIHICPVSQKLIYDDTCWIWTQYTVVEHHGRLGLWPFRFVAVPVCDRFGLWPFRSVAVPVCGRFCFWPFQFVVFLFFGRFGFGRFCLWPLWPVTFSRRRPAFWKYEMRIWRNGETWLDNSHPGSGPIVITSIQSC